MPGFNLTPGGGAQIPLNLFVQPDEPTTKDGIWIEATEKHTVKNITDKNSFTIGGEIRTYDDTLKVGNYFFSATDTDRTVMLKHNGDIYYIKGRVFSFTLYLYIYRWDHTTNTVSTAYTHSFGLHSSVPTISATIGCISGTALYAAVSGTYAENASAGTIICTFDLETQTGTEVESTVDLLTGIYDVQASTRPSGQIGFSNGTAYYVYRKLYYDTGTSSFIDSTILSSFDFSTSTRVNIKTIVSGSSMVAGWKSYSEGIFIDDKLYYQCFYDTSDASQNTIRIFDTTTNTETTQSLGYNLKPSLYGIAAYQNKLYLHCTDSDTTLHEFEIGVWTNQTIQTFAITIVAIIQIGTSLAVLDSSGHVQYYDFVSETLAENTLAILDGISRKVQLMSTTKQSIPLYFQDVWWYSTDFNEYPTYIGDGTTWTKYKN